MTEQSVRRVLNEAHFRLGPLSEAEQGALLRTLLQMSPHGVLVTGLDHKALACNDEFGRIYKVDPASVPDMDVEELRAYVYPRLREPQEWVDQLETIYQDQGRTYSDELELQNPRLWVRRITGPLVAGNEIVGRLWTFEDITSERKRQRFREATQQVSLFHNADPSEICDLVTETVASVYQTISILSILKGDAMVFRSIANLPPGVPRQTENLLRNSYCQTVMTSEHPIIIQNGKDDPRVCNIPPVAMGLSRYMGSPIIGSDNKPIGTLCILDSKSDEILDGEDLEFIATMARRISVELERERLYVERTRTQAETVARQQLELFHTERVLAAMNEGVSLLDECESEQQLLRRQEEILQGQLGFESVRLIPGGKGGSKTAKRKQIQIGGDRLVLEFAEPSVSLPPGFVDAHIAALADQIALTISSFRMQHQLREAHRELRAAQGRLIQAEKLSVVGTLAASVAHDIRNILSSVSLAASAPGDPAENLRKVRVQTERFNVLSHRLLSYVKPRFVARQPVDLINLISRSISIIESQARAAKASIEVVVPPTSPEVQADPGQAEHLLVNLLMNALQAMMGAGGCIKVTCSIENEGVRVVIGDSGKGIPADLLDHIFEPFVSSRKDGFGLGLYSCKRIADDHGWTLTARSEEGKGAEFDIFIPKES
ncbi:MAG: GAF domain-containing protein [Armatimonadetes bacterium]|nr:GAF domain-containing protein [Armatimonadota bacterium]